MKKQIQLKTKEEMLEMGYENNYDPQDYLNLLAGEFVTLDLTKTRKSGEGIIYFCDEYPEYIIFDYFIKRVVAEKESVRANGKNGDYEYSNKEIAAKFGISHQRVDAILKNVFGVKLKGNALDRFKEEYIEGIIWKWV